ncbi:calnexin-like [Xenia sp. Carnegie-2017]|uniref:calnexin-like n=1 Tax=Xenia sp. Carnegie-2017 TaxID=2897299 RepID=UPI001F04FAC5|nr:calnexin-like [Xenia sp. Carnegie-2017]
MKFAHFVMYLCLFLLCTVWSDQYVLADDSDSGEDVAVQYKLPEVASAYLFDPFESEEEFKKRWIVSEAKKDGVDSEISKYDGIWAVEESSEKLLPGDLGLVLKSKAKHHAIALQLNEDFEFDESPLIVQYEVQFQVPLECGGAYLKLISKADNLELSQFQDKTPYTIMFGPDKCGLEKKLHFIFRHKNPNTGAFEEKHAKIPSDKFDSIFDDKKSHLLRLVVQSDNSFEIFLDSSSIFSGSLLKDVEPPVNPPAEIDDPNDSKPENWDEREKIPDPDAEKPDDWDEEAPATIPDPDAKKPEGWLDDEPQYIPDPKAVKPDDWDNEEDGEWEPPQIANPKCEKVGCGEWERPTIDNPDFKGKWSAPLITNPSYQGIWKPRRIPNPDFFEDKEPFRMTPIAAVGFELWSMTENILFDNLLITDDLTVADKLAEDSWALKATKDGIMSGEGSVVSNLMEATKERPWLWLLYAVVVIVPFILIAACCFPSSKVDEAALKKKTDEPTEDVKDDDENGSQEKKEETEVDDEENKKEESNEQNDEDDSKEKEVSSEETAES